VLVIFVADASVAVWRRGDRRKALMLGGSIVFFVLAGAGQSMLVFWGIIQAPIMVSLCYLGIIVAMGYELSRDVLRAARLSDELRVSEEQMALAAEVAGFGVWMWSIAGNQIWGSERWLRLFGFTPDATVSFEKFMQRIHPDDRERVEYEVWRALEDRRDYVGEYRVILPDGTQRWVGARGRMYPDAHGKPSRMLGASIEITERKRIEEALRVSEDRVRFETLLTDLSARFIHLPADQVDGGIEGAQQQICELLGIDVSTLWQLSADHPSRLLLTHL
jgi:PAS domain S-box-containing protein